MWLWRSFGTTSTVIESDIAAWENDVPEHAVTESHRDRVYVSLYHAHVPKLVDEKVVTFDEDTERMTAAENAEQVLAVLILSAIIP